MAKRTAESSSWIRTFEVVDVKKHKKGFTVYNIISTVFPKFSPDAVTRMSVWKRYNDLRKLSAGLEEIHRNLYLKGEFPKFPKPKVFGRFEYDVVEERRKAILNLLNFAALHSQLFTSKLFVKFFEESYNACDIESSSEVHSAVENGLSKELPPCLVPERTWSSNVINISSNENCPSENSDTPTESPNLLSGSNSLSSSLGSLVNDAAATVDLNRIHKNGIRTDVDSTTQTKISNSVSCSALNSNVKDKSIGSSNNTVAATVSYSVASSCTSLSSLKISPKAEKKSNGFGLSSLLPNFSKKTQLKSRASEEQNLSESLTSSYICQAAGHFTVAQQFESNSDISSAFNAYKEGISVLLNGVKDDTDKNRRSLVKKKLEKYMAKAESLQSSSERVPIDDFEWVPSPRNLTLFANAEPSVISELRSYKVVGRTKNRILIVQKSDSSEENPMFYGAKVLSKSVLPMDTEKPDIVLPNNIPFMNRLIQWFDTENAIVLLLNYDKTEALMDFLHKSVQPTNEPSSSENPLLFNAIHSSIDSESHQLFDSVQNICVVPDSTSSDLNASFNNYDEESIFNWSNDSEQEISNFFTLPTMIPEPTIKVWAAQMVLALEKLHSFGVHYGDLSIQNILLNSQDGNILLTYTGFWKDVDQLVNINAFSAPEVRNSVNRSVWKIHPVADWWSFGAILFLLFIGKTVDSYHAEGFLERTVVQVPEKSHLGTPLSQNTRSLICELLQCSPSSRLGFYGAEEVKSHPFFEDVDWDYILMSSVSE